MNEQTRTNPYVNEYFSQLQQKEEDTLLTKNMKSQFSFFGIASALYAFFYAFCLYKNASGITCPFFVTGTLCYFFLSMKKLRVPCKKDSLFYIVSTVLLGISNCLTDSSQLLWMNKLGIFFLTFILFLHTIYQDTEWSFLKYAGALLCTIGSSFSCLNRPFRDMRSFFAAKKQQKEAKNAQHKNNNLFYIFLGFIISLPLLAVIILLLSSADAVFHRLIFEKLLENIFYHFYITDFFNISILIVTVFFASYTLIAALCCKKIPEETTDKRVLEPVIGITVTFMLTIVYLIFSMIQILYLFIGKMKLPEGYTYSAYARQGFFQLLAVCILNLILVLFCISFFRDNLILKIMLTIISGCTFIMIFSSAFRMLLYISVYRLTFLRVFVLWALAVIFLLMAGVTTFIYKRQFPLFFYSVAVTTVLYLCFSFARPDYWIARYNTVPYRTDYESRLDLYHAENYLYHLSADAAPILCTEELNALYHKNWRDLSDAQYAFYSNIRGKSERMNFRTFNFSIYCAKKSADL